MPPIDSNGIVCTDIFKARFDLLASEEIEKISVCAITDAEVFSMGSSIPNPGGIHDLRMGPLSREHNTCSTCMKQEDCPSHIGHLPLCHWVMQPIMIKSLVNVLKMSCLMCSRLTMGTEDRAKLVKAYANSNLTSYNQHELALASTQALLEESTELPTHISSANQIVEEWLKFRRESLRILSQQKKCPHCMREIPKKINPLPKTDGGIVLYWSPDKQMPFDLSIVGHIDEAAGDVIDERTAKSMGVKATFAKRGVQSNSITLQARTLEPIIRALFESEDIWVLEKIYPITGVLRRRGFCGSDAFFMKNIPVSGNKFRPFNESGGFGGGGNVPDGPGGTMHPRT